MTAQQLKNAILQEAIQGRLVPQDPNDEPASVLLDRIRKEKLQLVKEGKLKKKDLEEKPISEDEIPFEIPDSWEWCRIRDLFETSSGSTPQSKAPKYYSNGSVNWVRTTDLNNGVLDLCEIKITKEAVADYNLSIIPQDSVCIAMYGGGGTIGKHSIIKFDTTINQSVCAIFPNGHCCMDYVHIFMQYQRPHWMDYAAGSRKDPNINQVIIKNCLIPIPPVAEQKRIVAKIEEVMPKVEEYGKAQEALDKLNEKLPEKLKKSILQETIEGRLVPQGPNDEPASVLLDKIRKEKAKLVKEGKLKKKDLDEIPISEDEKPLVLPKNWEWVRLIDIGFFLSGQTPKPAELESTGDVPYFKVSDMNTKGNERFMNITSLYLKKNSKYKTFPKNSIIYPKNGGALLTNKKRILVRDSLVDLNTGAFVPSKELYFEYIYCLFSTIDFRKHFKGTALPTVDMESINRKIVPLPPLAEQKRIVEKLEQLFKEIDKLKTK